MKRSEMIGLMCEQSFIKSHGMLENRLDKEEATAILSFLEQSGMLPPYRDVVIEGHQCDENSWEPEDSKNTKSNKIMPSPLTEEELEYIVTNDEDLRNET